jgi:4a-hydroxytetrahydrobiopterin dehydratase
MLDKPPANRGDISDDGNRRDARPARPPVFDPSIILRDGEPKPCERSGMEKLSPEQIKAALAAVPEWRQRGNAISRTYAFKDFPAAIKFVQAVAGLAEQAQHHPDIDIRWNQVTLTLTTHDAGGLTGKDFALAGKFDGRSLC